MLPVTAYLITAYVRLSTDQLDCFIVTYIVKIYSVCHYFALCYAVSVAVMVHCCCIGGLVQKYLNE